MARGAEAALGETDGRVRQIGCLELAPEDTLPARRAETEALAEEAAEAVTGGAAGAHVHQRAAEDAHYVCEN